MPRLPFRKRPTGATTAKAVDEELNRVRSDNARTDANLRKLLGYGSLAALLVQLIAVNYVFYRYGHAEHWKLPEASIAAWLGATLGQIFLILRLVGRYLFPPINVDGKPPEDRP